MTAPPQQKEERDFRVTFITPVRGAPLEGEPGEDEERSSSEEIARAAFGDQTEAATDAVAQARGVTCIKVRDESRPYVEAEPLRRVLRESTGTVNR